MIITRTPFRMSFFGGGTDMPEYFHEHTGAVLSTTFNKYCYVTVRHLPRFFDYSNEIVYSRIERTSDLTSIEHPAVREAMHMLDMRELRVSYEADLPARTGLGTSSSFAVGMLNAFHSLKGSFVSKKQLAKEAIYLERELCAEAGGWQDQVAVAFGGFNKITFAANQFAVSPIIISPTRKKALENCLKLFFTGFTRSSSEVQSSISYGNKFAQLDRMRELVDEAESVLQNKRANLDDFGILLNHSWQLKRHMSSAVSNDSVDRWYNEAISAGALGGKLLGAGGGGFLLLYVPEAAYKPVRTALSDLLEVPFCFEDEGTRVIHYSPEEYEEK